MEFDLEGVNQEGLLSYEDELSAPLRATMEQSAKENPDARAKIIDLSDRAKADPQLVESNPEQFEQKLKVDDINLDGLVKSSPGTAKFLTDFNNAAVSQDDTTLLERLESIGKKIKPFTTLGVGQRIADFSEAQLERPENFTEGVGGTIAKMALNTIDGFKLKRLDGPIDFGLTGDEDLTTGLPPALGQRLVESRERKSKQIDDIVSQITTREQEIAELTPEDMTFFQEATRTAITSLAVVLPAFVFGAVTRTGTAGVLAPIGTQVYGDSYANARGKGLDPQSASMYAGLQAGIEVGTELLPVKTLMTLATTPGMSNIGRNVTRFMVQEMGTEQLATLGQSITDYAFDLDEQLAAATSPQEMLAIQARRQALTAVSTLLSGGVQSGLAAGINRTATALMTEEQRQAAAQQTEQMQIDELTKTVEESKLKQRSPKTFKKFMQQAVNADQKEIYIDAVQAKLYLNSLDPQAIKDDAGLSLLYRTLQEDPAPNGDVAIRLSDFAADFVGSPSFETLRPHMKLSPETDTPFRAEADSNARVDYVRNLMEQAQQNESQYVENQQIFNNVVDQLVETGQVPRKLANYYGQLIPAWVTVKSNELGVSPLELYEEMGLKVLGPYAERQAAVDRGQVLEQPGEQAALVDELVPAAEQDAEPTDQASPVVPPTIQPMQFALRGAPTAVNIPNVGRTEFGIHQPAVDAARAYAERSGINYVPIGDYAPVDVERAQEIAAAFEQMKHDPQNPEVKAAYKQMIKETLDQFDAIMQDTGLQIDWVRGQDPYGNSPREMILDVINNNHMFVFSTRDGFGSDDKFDPKDNPLLQETQYKIDGIPMLVNDVFRVVHDYFGHVKHGVGFRAGGEENAWQAHASMYSPLARRAMTTETRGQNSWVNYGPYGESNRVASPQDTIFADQKIGLMPIWVSEDGRLSDYERQQRFNSALRAGTTGFEGAIDERGRVELVHYSKQPIESTDPGRWGNGLSGRGRTETNRRLAGAPGRTYFGIESATTNGYVKERGLGDFRSIAKVPGHLIYDLNEDPHNFYNPADMVGMEQAIKDNGYMGFWVNHPQLGKVAAIFDGVRVEQAQVFFQDLRYNDLGLYSAVEKAFSDLKIQGWDGKSQVEWTDENQAELDAIGPVYSSNDPNAPRYRALVEQKRKAEGLANGRELWAKISKTPGVKKEELEWMGLEEFLTAEPKGRFTRAEVLDFVRDNGVVVEEVVADIEREGADSFEGFDWREDIQDDESFWYGRAEDFMYDAERDDFDWMDDSQSWFDTWFLENSNAFFEHIDGLRQDELLDEESYNTVKDLMQNWLEVGNDTTYVTDVMEAIETESGITLSQIKPLMDDVRELAEEKARDDYMEDPVIEYFDQQWQVSITGNPDFGYTVYDMQEGRDIDDGIYDFESASDAAMNYLSENGRFLDEEAAETAKWGAEQYVMDGQYDNYRELKFIFDAPDGTFSYDVHFPDDNVLAFLRISDRELKNGVEPDANDASLPPLYEGQFVEPGDPRIAEDTLPMDLFLVVFGKKVGDVVVGSDVNEGAWKTANTRWSEMDQKKRAAVWNEGQDTLIKLSKAKRAALSDDVPDSTNTFFIDEFQSDWHQQGRQKGYSTGLDAGELDQQAQVYLDEQSVTGAEIAARFERLITFNDERGTDFEFELFKETEFDFATLAKWGRLDYPSNDLYQTVKKAGEYLKDEKLDALLAQYKTSASKASQLIQQAEAQRYGVPDAPFKGDAWINLGLKRALVDAVNKGYESFAWVDSNVLSARWSESYRKLYEIQYDTKMASMVKKLTGIKPVHLDQDGNPHVHQEQGYWVIPITDELREKVQSEGFTLFQNQSRGYYDPENIVIRLNESSDASTFLHEFAHFMLDMEGRTNGSQMEPIKAWWMRNSAEIADEAGVEQGKVEQWITAGPQAGLTAEEFDAINRATHEQFARGFETYVMEGKAPSIELRNAFRVFARLLRTVYNAITGNLNKPRLDDEMRKVFDRLLASDEQMAAEMARSRYEPLFTDAAMAGMTEDQYKAYLERSRKAQDKAVETVRDKLMKEMRRTAETWWNRELDDLTEQNMVDLMNTRTYATRERIRSQDDFKLDRAAVKELMGLDAIPPALRNMTVTGAKGAMPDDAAAVLGYESGAEMLNDLMNAPKLADAARSQAEQQMIEIHGDMMNDGTLERMVQDAARNEERASLILSEIQQLSRGSDAPKIDKKTLKFLAAQNIGKLALRDIRPDRYRRAEIRSAQDAARAMQEGNTDAALRAKTQQVMNMYLWKESMAAREQGDRITRYMARFNKKTIRERIGKAGNGYWDQIVNILERFEFRRGISMKQNQLARQSLEAWYAGRSEDGDNLVLSPEVFAENYRKHWKEVPIEELTGIYESVISIEHNARSANEIVIAEEKVTFEQAIQRGLNSMSRLANKFNAQRTDIIDKRNPVRRFVAELTKVPFLVSWLDGGERVGSMHDLIMAPMNKAAFQEQELWKRVGMSVVKAIQNRSKEQIKRHGRKLYIPEIKSEPTEMHSGHDGNLYGHQVIAVALNTGNESNLRKMLIGEGWAADDAEVSIDNPKLQAVLQHMTQEDWDLVQLIWNQINELYPILADVHQRTSGLPLPKVDATPIETPYGTYAGGYYPVHYDANRSQRAAENAEKANEQTLSMFNSAGLLIPTVSTGSRIERTEYVGPIKLSLGVVQDHMHEVIHFVTHYEAVRQVSKVIKEPRIAEAIKAKMGKSEYDILKPWLNDVAKDGRAADSRLALESALGRLRTGVTLGVMGFKASTILIQGSGIFNTMAETGSLNVLRAMRSVFASDASIQQAYSYAFENSQVMKYRVQNMDREMRNVLGGVEGKSGLWAKMQQVSMMGIGLFQTYTVDVVSWYAGYLKGMKDFEGDQARAFKYADFVVENAQGSGSTKDMAAIMRNRNEAWRLLTMFMTFFSSLGNMIRDTSRGVTSGQYTIASTAAKAMFMFMLPGIYEAVMREGVPDDEEEMEELIEKITFNAAMMPTATVPILRDIANGVGSGFGYNASPVFSTIEKGVESTPLMLQKWSDEEEMTRSQIKNFSRLVGAWFKVPGVNQMWGSYEHIEQVLDDGEEFSTRQLLFGPDRD